MSFLAATFCRSWPELTTPERHAVVVGAEPAAEGEADASQSVRACRAGLAAGVRRKLDAECRNWPELMDFEVRMIVDGVYGACEVAPPAET